MANYMSSPVDYGKTIDSSATDLLGKVATLKQQKYDANYALVQNTLDQYGNIDLLRNQDKEYLSEKLQKVTDVVNNSGNRDLSRNNVTRSIQSQIKSVLDDNVLTQIAQTEKYRAFEKEVANVKKSKPELYSDVNYSFARAEAGFDEYMNGVDEQGNKVDKLGNLKYKSYKNLPEIHSKRLMDYVAQYDDEQLLKEGVGLEGTAYHTVDIYGKRVLKEDLKKFLEVSMDADEREQLNINTWGKIGNLSNGKANDLVKPVYEKQLEDLKSDYAEKKAQVDSGKAKDTNKVLQSMELSIKNLSERIKTNSFTKDDAYSLYNDDYLNNMASSFDKDIITKKDVQDASFEEYKFETGKKQWELTFDQKERENALKAKEVSIMESQTFGTKTKIEVDTEGTEKVDSPLKNHYAQYDATTTKLIESLSNDDPEFAKKSFNAKMAYINGLDFSDPSKIKGTYSKETIDLHNSWKPMVEVNREAISEEIKSNQKVVIGSFYDMQDSHFSGEELNLSKTAKYLPITSQLILDAKAKGKKKLTWADIPVDKRYAIQAEFLNANVNQYGADLSWDDKKMKATASYTLTKKIKDKNVLSAVISADKNYKGSDVGYIEEGWGGLKEFGKLALGIASDVGSSFKWGYNAVKEGTDYADKEFDKDMEESYKPDFNKLSGILNVTPQKFVYDLTKPLLREEENLGNIESRDLLGRENIRNRFKNAQEVLTTQRDSKIKATTQNLDYTYGFSFSTENKAQKAVADELAQVVTTSKDVEEGLVVLPKDNNNNFTIAQKGDGYEISYITGGDKDTKDKIAKIFVSELPQGLMSKIDQTKDNWNKSFYNPTVKIPKFTISPYNTEDEAVKAVENLVSYGNVDPLVAEQMLDMKRGIFKTTLEYVRQNIEEDLYKANEKIVNSFLNQDFRTETTLSQDGRLKTILKYNHIKDGKPTTSEPYYSYAKEKDDSLLRINAQTYIDAEKKSQLKSLK